MEPAVPPNLCWSKTVCRVLKELPADVRDSFEYLGPANAVLHVALPSSGGSAVSRALYASPYPRPAHLSSRFASGAHKRIRLKNPVGQSVVMQFDSNTIHAGCNTPPAALSSAFSYLLHSKSNDRAFLYRRGFSLNIPNIVVSARTSFPVRREFLLGVPWTNSSPKFPGFAVISKRLRGKICPELYPSRSDPPKHMNMVIPGIQDAGSDLADTLTLLAELLKPCRDAHLAAGGK